MQTQNGPKRGFGPPQSSLAILVSSCAGSLAVTWFLRVSSCPSRYDAGTKVTAFTVWTLAEREHTREGLQQLLALLLSSRFLHRSLSG